MTFSKYYFTEEDAIKFANYLKDIKLIDWGEEYKYENDDSSETQIRLGTFSWGASKFGYIYKDGFTNVKDLVDDIVKYLKVEE